MLSAERCTALGGLRTRFDDLRKGLQARQGNSGPEDWTFLALAHYRLGHRAEATSSARSASVPPEACYEFERVWREFVIQRLRSEAEAVILYDPAFPKDPFAH